MRAEALEKHSRLQYGFIAQEVEEVFPDWVRTDADGFKQIDMSRLTAVLVEGLKEQHEVITRNQGDINALNRRVAELEDEKKSLGKRLAAIEARLSERDEIISRLARSLSLPRLRQASLTGE